MSTVTTTYNRYSTLENDPQYAVRAAMERFKKSQSEEVAKKKNDDLVAFSDQGKALAASAPRSREELEALAYEPLLRFQTEDGSLVTVDLAREGEEGEELYTAARLTVTGPDGSVMTLYVSGDAGQPEAEETSEEESPDAAPAEETVPSLLELIEEYGLNKTADASEGLFAAIRARIEAMIEAAEETVEETEALEKIHAERESRNETASGTGATEGEDDAQRTRMEGGSTGASRSRTLSSYTRNAAAPLTAGMSRFSRHY